jgi:hypothetical protein
MQFLFMIGKHKKPTNKDQNPMAIWAFTYMNEEPYYPFYI